MPIKTRSLKCTIEKLLWHSKNVVYGIIVATEGGGAKAGNTRVYRAVDEAESTSVRTN